MTLEDILRLDLDPTARAALIRAIGLEDVVNPMLDTPLVEAAIAAGWYREPYTRTQLLAATTAARAAVVWAAVKDDLEGTDCGTATFTFHPASGKAACWLELESFAGAVLPKALED
jgi:hypothetical protein